MDLHRFWDGVITSSQNLTRLRNEATVLRNPQGFQRSQLTELASTGFEPWAKESYEIATKIAYLNGRLVGAPRDGNKDCQTVATAPVLPKGYVVNASRIADRRLILTAYRLADLLKRVTQNFDWGRSMQFNPACAAKCFRYLITLSARASTFGGIVRLICFVVFRLITNFASAVRISPRPW